ncbi:BGTF surface domain-containing protein [Halorussus halophilus]|uniref:BGTF surface domain-containing protein n=1 Tax=Halorussus halophilus TaxID=2650975 RepID=UPI001300D9B5|nr:BGTF surface domain-containing protein [Halorussus halophilus]
MFERQTQFGTALAVAIVLLAVTTPPLVSGAPSAKSAELTPNASFTPQVVHEHRGDIATITVDSPKSGYVNIGSQDTAFWLKVKVGSGTTELKLNTYKAGMADSTAAMKAALDGGTVVNNPAPTPLDKPLGAAQYEMNVTMDNGQEIGIGKLIIEERATNSIETRIAPEKLQSQVENLEITDLPKQTVEPWNNGSVAHEDWVSIHVNASGLSGMLTKEKLDGHDGDGIQLKFTQTSGELNEEHNEFWASEDATYFIANKSGEGFFVLIDTNKHGIGPGERYNVTFSVKRPLASEKGERVSTSFKTVPRRTKINRNGAGEEVVVDGKTTISGKTTLTPGSTINLTVRNQTLPQLFMTKQVEVRGDRTFATNFDFSDVSPGRAFEIRLPDSDRKKSVPGVVAGGEPTTPETTTPPTTTRPPTTTPDETDTPVQTTTTEPTTPATTAGYTQAAIGATESPLTERPLENASQSQEGGESLVPGFGVELAIVALAGAVLLARRSSGR